AQDGEGAPRARDPRGVGEARRRARRRRRPLRDPRRGGPRGDGTANPQPPELSPGAREARARRAPDPRVVLRSGAGRALRVGRPTRDLRGADVRGSLVALPPATPRRGRGLRRPTSLYPV